MKWIAKEKNFYKFQSYEYFVFLHLTRKSFIECPVVKVLMKFGTNLKLFIKAQIK